MYRTCLFCNRDLGTNEVLETFPVGERLAFDPQKGRLWVVCRKCERWNLSPLEERREAIEAAERFFRDTRIRVSTENIGLARHPSGLVLVRVGRPLRPEFAAWRYGDQFGRRRRRYLLVGGAATLALGSVIVVGTTASFVGAGLLSQSGNLVSLYVRHRTFVKLRDTDGTLLKLKSADVAAFQLVPDGVAGPWSLRMGTGKHARAYAGDEARRVASIVVPRLNAAGAGAKAVRDAVQSIDLAGGPEPFLADLERMKNHRRYYHTPRETTFSVMTPVARLGLEMALHEEQERRALEGELKELELAWQAAEEIAAISDDLLLPPAVRRRGL